MPPKHKQSKLYRPKQTARVPVAVVRVGTAATHGRVAVHLVSNVVEVSQEHILAAVTDD